MRAGVLLALTACAGICAALPCAAAPLGQRPYELSHRIDQGARDGSLTRKEAYTLRYHLWRIERRARVDRRYGLNQWERRDLQRRYDRLSTQVYQQRHNSQQRWNRRWW